jgi:hypothetical protein
MLSQFNNEVLSYGPTAVLPQNLNSTWIKKLQKLADDFLDSNFTLHECKDPRDIGDPVLMACVYEILGFQQRDSADVSPQEMAEKMAIYSGFAFKGTKVMKAVACRIPVRLTRGLHAG